MDLSWNVASDYIYQVNMNMGYGPQSSNSVGFLLWDSTYTQNFNISFSWSFGQQNVTLTVTDPSSNVIYTTLVSSDFFSVISTVKFIVQRTGFSFYFNNKFQVNAIYKMGSKVSIQMIEGGNYGDYNYLSNLQVYFLTGFPQTAALVMGNDIVPNTDDLFYLGSSSYTFNKIYVNNIVTKNSQLNIQGSGSFNGYINSSGYTNTSDERIKKDLQLIDSNTSLSIINNIKPYVYTQQTHSEDISQVPGFISQEIEKLYPTAIFISDGFIPNVQKYYPVQQVAFIDNRYYEYQIDINDLGLTYPIDICLRLPNKTTFYPTAYHNNLKFNSDIPLTEVFFYGT
ncbi:tail fiber domain-containing protein, partial [bacterium]|nr:tail fiber domain-containing protein [Candidatus Elulimicrobium humile]